MKQRFFLLCLLALSIFIYFNIVLGSEDNGAVRVKAPSMGQAGAQFYYSKNMNPFYPEYAPYYKNSRGYVIGNCTWYAWGRACEIRGSKPEHSLTGNASEWWEKNKKGGYYPFGKNPERGAIICYKTHVGVVEQAKPLIISESGWTVDKKRNPIIFHCGKPWRKKENPLGFIYIK